MASNPMQKKSRNSFLLGMLLMLIIAAVAMAAMFFLLKKDEKKQEEQAAAQTYVYRLNTSVKSGEEITSSKVTSVLVASEAAPKGAFASKTKVTKDGKDNWVDKSFSYSGYKSKIDLDEGTILSDSMLYEDKALQASERIQEYNMLQLPIQLDPGEYVDIRLHMPNGQDYIVVSHKEVKDITADTIWLQLAEEEILLMSNAMVESYIAPASNIYVTKYVEPGMQTAASITYVPSQEVAYLIQQNPNIVKEAKDSLVTRYTNESALRNNIQTELNKYSDQAIDNIQAQMEEAREKAKQAREEFLYGVN